MSNRTKNKKHTAANKPNADALAQVHTSSGNIFADLGLPQPEKHLAKAELARQIGAIIHKMKWDQKQAAEKLGIDQPKVSNLVRGKLNDFSLERLMDFLSSLDQDVLILIRPSKRNHRAAVQVVKEQNRDLVHA